MSIRRDEALLAVERVEWTALPGDPDDMLRFAEGLRAWIGSDDAYERSDGLDAVLDLAHYLAEIPETCEAIMGLVPTLLACEALEQRASLISLCETLLRFEHPEHAVWLRDALAQHLTHPDPMVQEALTRLAVELFGRVPPSSIWLGALHGRLEGGHDEMRAVALIALSRAGLAEPLIDPLLAGSSSPQLAAAVAFAIRIGGGPIEGARRAHASEFGQPGVLAASMRRLQLHDRILEGLPPFAAAVASDDTVMEAATVEFAGRGLVQVRHPERGAFTLRIPGDGLRPGDTVLIGNFVPPPTHRPLAASWRVDGQQHLARFQLDGSRLS